MSRAGIIRSTRQATAARLGVAALAVVAVAVPAAARADAVEDAALCAALWHGYADTLKGSASQRSLAEAYAAAAIRLAGDDGAARSRVDQLVRADRRRQATQVKSMVNGQSVARDLFEHQAQACDAIGADLTETANMVRLPPDS